MTRYTFIPGQGELPQPERGFWSDVPKQSRARKNPYLAVGPTGHPIPLDRAAQEAPMGTPFPKQPKPKIRRHSTPAKRVDFRFLVWDISIWRRPKYKTEEYR